MTVTSSQRSESYGPVVSVPADLPVPFTFYAASSLEVYATLIGVETLLEAGQYSVTGGAGQLGTVTIQDGDLIGATGFTIVRVVPFTQTLELQPQGPFPVTGVMRALDEGVMRAQQIQDQVDLLDGSSISEAELTAEAAIRAAGDTTLASSITSAVAAEATLRASADTALSNGLTAETSARVAAVSAVAGNLATETAARVAAASGLDGRLTTLESTTAGESQLASTAPPAVAVVGVVGVSTLRARGDHTHAHGNQTSGVLHALADLAGSDESAKAGFVLGAERARLLAVTTPALDNGDFLYPGTGGTGLSDWSLTSGSWGTTAITPAIYSLTGAEVPNNGVQFTMSNNVTLQSSFKFVAPGGTYGADVFARQSGAYAGTACTLSLVWLNTLGATIGTLSTPINNTNGVYTKFSVAGMAPAGTRAARVVLTATSAVNVTTYFDKARLQRVDVPPTGVYARARQNTAQSFAGGLAVMRFDVAVFDSESGFSGLGVAGTRWTCPAGKAGLYRVDFISTITQGASSDIFVAVQKNGTEVERLARTITDGHFAQSGSVLMPLVPGDYVQACVYSAGTRSSEAGQSSLAVVRLPSNLG